MKLYFLDFDRTLCVHDYVKKAAGPSTYFEECLTVLNKERFQAEYGRDVAPGYMKWYVRQLLADKDNQCFVLTHEIFNLRDGYKKDFAERNYGLDRRNYLSVNSPDHKVPMMLAMAESMGLNPDDCYLIDDSVNTLYEAEREEINGIHISNVMVMYERHLAEHDTDKKGD